MAIAGIEKYWCDVGKAIESVDPEKAARAYLNGGNYAKGYEILLDLYQKKAEAIANNGMNAKDLESTVNAIEQVQTVLDRLRKKDN